MTNPMIRIHNTETNEIIDREMNADEFAQYKKDLAESAKATDEIAAAKEAILTKLGITADEAALLLS
jgi:predicted metal-binding transcription factor (methanogenesis marker protein 9)